MYSQNGEELCTVVWLSFYLVVTDLFKLGGRGMSEVGCLFCI